MPVCSEMFVHDLCAPVPRPPNQQSDGLPLDFVFKGDLKQNCEHSAKNTENKPSQVFILHFLLIHLLIVMSLLLLLLLLLPPPPPLLLLLLLLLRLLLLGPLLFSSCCFFILFLPLFLPLFLLFPQLRTNRMMNKRAFLRCVPPLRGLPALSS